MSPIEVGTEAFNARGRVEEGAERDRLFAAHVAALPHFAKYQAMTERPLPVVTFDRLQ